MGSWKQYLLWFAQEHIDFRLFEIESIVSLLNIQMRFIEKPKSIEPFLIVELKSDEDLKQIAKRSVSIRSCLELWAYDVNINKVHETLKKKPISFYREHFATDKSFKITVETFSRHFTHKEKLAKIESFSYLPIEGRVQLSNPDLILQYIEYYTRYNDGDLRDIFPNRVFFGRWISDGMRHIIKKLSLKTRKFIGNTSMDAQLSLLMANQAKVKCGDIVLDPFVGSGSLLVAAAQFGAFVFGSDIDYLMLHARTKPSRITQKMREYDESIQANMRQYGLEAQYLDVLVADFATNFWCDRFKFDAIITDPPYGIREATGKVGTLKENYSVKEEHLATHIPAKIEYGISNIYKDLLEFSVQHLRLNGRLVVWFPVFRGEQEGLPSHPCLKLVANSEQILTQSTSRRLLTFEKIKELQQQHSQINNNIVDFRIKYFVVREETRKIKRTREAKIREENRVKYSEAKPTE